MGSISIDVPDDIMIDAKIPKRKIKDTLKKELATALYREGILSLGGARRLANMTKTDFHFFLGNKQIERQYDFQDYIDDVENIERWQKK
jgi:predicted HTH domain antitoxin